MGIGRGGIQENIMTVTTRLAAILFSAAIVASTGVAAQARNLHAYAQAPRQETDMDIRKQCYAESNKRWPTTNQDLQTARWYAYTTCAAEHGIQNP
jgi:hypothetical protein